MGLTLTKEVTGGCCVTKVVPGGVSEAHGVALGQRVCGEQAPQKYSTGTAVATCMMRLVFVQLRTSFVVVVVVMACRRYGWY